MRHTFLLLCAAAAVTAAGAVVAIPADDSSVAWTGRTQRGVDGTVSFDWQGVSAALVLSVGSTRLSGEFVLAPGTNLKLRVYADRVDTGTILLNASSSSVLLISGLSAASAHTVLLVSTVQPAVVYAGAAAGMPLIAPMIVSFTTDGGVDRPATPPGHKLLVIGDGVAAGAGVLASPPCTRGLMTDDVTSSAGYLLATNLSLLHLGTIASGTKGVLANCCGDTGRTMSLQSLARLDLNGTGGPDWDFNNPTRPDVVIMALGTNDFADGRGSNATFVAAFEAAYVSLVANLALNMLSNGSAFLLANSPLADGGALTASLQRVVAATQALGLPVQFLDWGTGVPLDGCEGFPGVAGQHRMFELARPAVRAAVMATAAKAAAAEVAPLSPYLLAMAASARASTAAAAAALEATASRRYVALPSPSRDVNVTVRSDGSGDFSSVQAALDACHAGSDPSLGHVTLHLLGTFRERVAISTAFTGGVTLIGDGASPDNALIIANRSGAAFSTWYAHTLFVGAKNVTLVNVAVANDAGKYGNGAGQSPALHIDVTADQLASFRCAFYGGVDTVYTGGAGYGLRSYFYDTYSNGTG